MFEELCVLREAAGLFLNADSAFDTRDLRQAHAARDIEATIARHGVAPTDNPFIRPRILSVTRPGGTR
ncbi:hypothetical protein IC235_21625 [Hymenobacter sp. BT664]|uniref:Uncharacterized protein n=1 Tax=Hymenobacter montanus TaxID=2771359 RepID=A0A927BI63_9BACT|nr:hypothetical protein [Hymenobacter montanus]MBD2770493.1 hypothetical protein [Hymenobacter montanus]